MRGIARSGPCERSGMVLLNRSSSFLSNHQVDHRPLLSTSQAQERSLSENNIHVPIFRNIIRDELSRELELDAVH